MDIFDGSYIQTTGRLYGDQKFRILVDLSCDDRFLLITTGHGTNGCDRTLTGTDIILFDQAVCIGTDRFSFQESKFIRKFRLKIPFQNDIVFQ